MKRFGFSFQERIHLQKDFEQIFKAGKFYSCPFLILWVFHKEKENSVRLGLIPNRKIGKANLRNKIKRRLREIFRLNKLSIFPGWDILIRPLPKCLELEYNQLEEEVLKLWKKAKLIQNI